MFSFRSSVKSLNYLIFYVCHSFELNFLAQFLKLFFLRPASQGFSCREVENEHLLREWRGDSFAYRIQNSKPNYKGACQSVCQPYVCLTAACLSFNLPSWVLLGQIHLFAWQCLVDYELQDTFWYLSAFLSCSCIYLIYNLGIVNFKRKVYLVCHTTCTKNF